MEYEDLIFSAECCEFKVCDECPSKEKTCCSEKAMQELATALEKEIARAEAAESRAEKAEKERDAICAYIDSEGLLRKYFCENGNADFEPFVCPSLKEHSGYIDSDDCEGCEHFCNSSLEKKEE